MPYTLTSASAAAALRCAAWIGSGCRRVAGVLRTDTVDCGALPCPRGIYMLHGYGDGERPSVLHFIWLLIAELARFASLPPPFPKQRIKARIWPRKSKSHSRVAHTSPSQHL